MCQLVRCIDVTTTLSEDTLKRAAPSLIRQEIRSISLDDIISGGSVSNNEKMQGPQLGNSSAQMSPPPLKDRRESGSFPDINSSNDAAFSIGGVLVEIF
ncbi:protein SUPPRESSOR OF QUENCHING 1, chloroplastic-like isoform X1 [Diospyros lotus]|uniref:protein SUPPRESSOR OF QUENCHING 1, chloroplastic-like isoform X1 n=1 Tax=Diospyros lotus TaxID=55363 RepID=UPI00225B89A1|nr:protein SUPPRESSOR OF QUENCHING 1, chloroplastic-like isoform X1 [Diospyros lotus]